MGWDFITYHNEHKQFRDSDLWLLRDFFLRGTEALAPTLSPSDAVVLRYFFEHWQWICPGVFAGTEFDAFVSDDHHRWSLLFRVMQSAADLICGYGEHLPLAVIHPIGASGGCYYTQDLPTRQLLDAIGRLCTLLSKHEPPKPNG